MFSSRKIESATCDSVAFRFVAGNHRPDHDTISEFRKRFLGQIKGWFKEILLIGKELGLVKLGNIYIDGIKVQPNALRHKAMSYEYIQKLEKQLEEEIDKLLEIMKTFRGFDQCYNRQAAVNDVIIIVGAYCNSHTNDKKEFIPAIESVS